MKRFLILLSGRSIKFFGNILKLSFYVFHFLFPKKRFTLPERANPLRKASKPTQVPRIIWQTNYTSHVTLPVYINYLFNRLMAPSFEYRFMVTEAREAFVRENYPGEIYHCYMQLQIGAAQADFWRLLVLQKFGGVYLDIDAHSVWSLASIVRPEYEELYLTTKRGEISNYFIASKPNNRHLEQMIKLIVKNIQEARLSNVYELTGPGVFNQTLDINTVNTAYYRYTCNQGGFTNEFFQYVDKPQGKWTKEQQKVHIIKKSDTGRE